LNYTRVGLLGYSQETTSSDVSVPSL